MSAARKRKDMASLASIQNASRQSIDKFRNRSESQGFKSISSVVSVSGEEFSKSNLPPMNDDDDDVFDNSDEKKKSDDTSGGKRSKNSKI